MNKFGDLVATLSPEMLEQVRENFTLINANKAAMEDLARANKDLRDSMWDGLRERFGLPGDRVYHLCELTGQVRDGGSVPEARWSRKLFDLERKNGEAAAKADALPGGAS